MWNWLRRWISPSQHNNLSARPSSRKLDFERLEDRINPITSVQDLTTLPLANMMNSMVGPGIKLNSYTYTGSNQAAGVFKGGASSVGFDTGVVLSSGRALDVVGPNSAFGISNSMSTAGDANLNTIVAPNITYDASVLDVQFVPQGSLLTFTFVFGSDEYPEYVNGAYNDVFAFYLNGKNVAVIPGTATPVSINNVNAGANSNFFVDNYTSFSRNTSMDGLTTTFNLLMTVKPNVSNRIKIAIADAGDDLFDSNVFIKAGSFSSPKIVAYNPVRYVFNAATRTYDGDMTISNLSNTSFQGPLFVVFTQLGNGMTVANAAGTTPSGLKYIRINAGLGAGQTVKIPLKISNPLNKPLNTFFIVNNTQLANILV